MLNVPFTVGLTGLLLSTTTSAVPLEARAPGPVEHWFASSHLGANCGGSAFQNFSGSSTSCNVIKDSKPPAEFIAEIKSILIGSDFGVYDFTFLPDDTCTITGLADIIHEVSAGQTKCVDISSTKPGSFQAENVSPSTPARSTNTLDARVGPVSIWNVTTYGDQNCGNEIQSFRGSGSSGCKAITGQVSDPRIPLSIETQSVFIHTGFGTYEFFFYSEAECHDGQTEQPVYQVDGAGRCIPLGELYPESFQVELVKTPLKSTRSDSTSVELRQICSGLATWGAATFTNANCAGTAVESFAGGREACGTGSNTTCSAIQAFSPEIESVLLTVDATVPGTYDFSFYPNAQCHVTGLNDRIYTVTAGQSSCIALPTGLDLRGIQEVFLG